MPSSVLITGGNGRTARHLVEMFLNHPSCPNLRVLVRHGGVDSLQKAFPLLTQTPHAIVVADYMDEATLTPVFRDVSVVIHNGPSVHQNEAVMAMSVIDAAKNAGVGHFLLCSVLHPMRSKLITHKLKLQVEEYLVESRMNYTIVQPTHYMQNVSLGHVMRTGKLPLGYSHSVAQGFVDLRDFCHVIRSIVSDTSRHNMATYELVSENMTYTEVANILQDVMHRKVECELIPPKDYITMLKEGRAVQNEYTEDAMERIIIYHNRWGLTGNSNVLQWLLGREPTTWQQYAEDMINKS
ncbi:NAD(P)-binding protein [Ramaria rubella]|nr:NAD(P)-binding protein [Ramaria rubella]